MSDHNVQSEAASARLGPKILKRVFSGGAWALAGRFTTTGAALLTNAMLARLLAPAELGVYFLNFSVLAFGTAVGTVGLNQNGLRWITKYLAQGDIRTANKIARLSLIVTLFGGLACAALYYASAGWLANDLLQAPALKAIAGATALWLVAYALQRVISELFRGFYEYGYATLFGGSISSLILLASISALALSKQPISLITVVLLAGASVLVSNLIAAGILLSRPAGHSPSMPLLRNLVKDSWPILITNITLILITQLDFWIIGATAPEETVAQYGVAFRLVLLVAIPFQLANAVVPPLITDLYTRGELKRLQALLRGMSTLAGLPALAVLVTFLLAGRQILAIIFGDFFTDAALILALLSLAQLFNVATGSCGVVLILTGFQRVEMRINIAVAAVSVPLMILGALYFGAAGVAAIVVFTSAVQNLSKLYLSHRYTGVWTHMTLNPAALRGMFR